MDNNFENCNQAVDHPIINLKTESEGLEVEYEVVPIYNTDYENDFRKKEINDKINDLDEKMAENQNSASSSTGHIAKIGIID